MKYTVDLYLKSLLVRSFFFQVCGDLNIQSYFICTTFTLWASRCILLPLSFTQSILACVQHLQPVTHICEGFPAEQLRLKSCWRAQQHKTKTTQRQQFLSGAEKSQSSLLFSPPAALNGLLLQIFAFFMTNTSDSWEKYKPVLFFQHFNLMSTNDLKQYPVRLRRN